MVRKYNFLFNLVNLNFNYFTMDYNKIESEIIKSTKLFAESHNITFDGKIESMIINSLRELKNQFEKESIWLNR